MAYLPTIRDLWKEIPSANFITYFLWFLYYLISVLYGIFVIHDWIFIMITGLDTLLLLWIVILIIKVKRGAVMIEIKDTTKKVPKHLPKLKKRKA